MGEACEVNGVGYSEIICIFSVCGLVRGSSGVMLKLNLTCVIRGECFGDSNGRVLSGWVYGQKDLNE